MNQRRALPQALLTRTCLKQPWRHFSTKTQAAAQKLFGILRFIQWIKGVPCLPSQAGASLNNMTASRTYSQTVKLNPHRPKRWQPAAVGRESGPERPSFSVHTWCPGRQWPSNPYRPPGRPLCRKHWFSEASKSSCEFDKQSFCVAGELDWIIGPGQHAEQMAEAYMYGQKIWRFAFMSGSINFCRPFDRVSEILTLHCIGLLPTITCCLYYIPLRPVHLWVCFTTRELKPWAEKHVVWLFLIHQRELTWNSKMEVWKMIILFNFVFFWVPC